MMKNRKFWITILSIIAVVCLISACYSNIKQARQNQQLEENLEALRASIEAAANETSESTGETPDATDETLETTDEISDATDNDSASTDESVPETTTTTYPDNATVSSEESAVPAVLNPYGDIFASYDDMVAWLIIPDTVIDYPVMWTPGDENYYLYRDFKGNDDNNGSLILDTDSSLEPLTTNLIIHGHNMRSGAMFGNLTDYENRDYYENHRQIILHTRECQRVYEVIAVFRSQVFKKSDKVFKYYKFFQAETQEEFDDFYQNIKELSLYDTGVTAEFGDHFITLSTCVYHVENGRFVVVAKEIEGGDIYLPVEE